MITVQINWTRLLSNLCCRVMLKMIINERLIKPYEQDVIMKQMAYQKDQRKTKRALVKITVILCMGHKPNVMSSKD